MYEKERELIGLIASQCKDMTEVHELMKNIFKGTIEEMLQSEMDEYLGYEKSDKKGNKSGNSRNGFNKKRLQSEFGEVELNTPRDRNGEFEPKIIGKYQTKTDNIEDKIIAMYANGICQDRTAVMYHTPNQKLNKVCVVQRFEADNGRLKKDIYCAE